MVSTAYRIAHITCKHFLYIFLYYELCWLLSNQFRPNGGEKDRKNWIMFRGWQCTFFCKHFDTTNKKWETKKINTTIRKFFLFVCHLRASKSELTVHWLITTKHFFKKNLNMPCDTCGLKCLKDGFPFVWNK